MIKTNVISATNVIHGIPGIPTVYNVTDLPVNETTILETISFRTQAYTVTATVSDEAASKVKTAVCC